MTGKEDKESKSSDKKKDPNPFSPENVQETMGNIYNAAVGGIPGASITVEQLAEEYRERYSGDVKRAARELANSQIAKCGLTGFVTGLGGLATLPVALPADVAGVLLIQLRMISAIATLGGLDPRSDQVQVFSYACLVKGGIADVLKSAGVKLGEGFAISAIKRIPGYVIANINKKVGFSLVTRFGGSRFGKQAVVNLSKMVPVVGGVIGGGFDAAMTSAAAARAITFFIDNEVPDMPAESDDADSGEAEV